MLQTEQDLQAKSGGLHYAFVICLGGFLLSGIVLAAQRLPSIALDSVRQTLGVGYSRGWPDHFGVHDFLRRPVAGVGHVGR